MNIKRILLLVTILLASTAACDPIKNVVWPQLVQCGPTVDELLPTVSTIIMDQGQPGETLSDQALRELEELARDHGPDTVACLVRSVVDGFLARDASRMASGYKPDPARESAAKRGQAFLSERGIEVAP